MRLILLAALSALVLHDALAQPGQGRGNGGGKGQLVRPQQAGHPAAAPKGGPQQGQQRMTPQQREKLRQDINSANREIGKK